MTPAAPAVLAVIALASLIACGGPRAVPESSVQVERGTTDPGTAPGPAPARYGPEPVAAPSPLESELLEEIRSRRAARSPLHRSSALALAARELAHGAAAGVEEPLAPDRLRTALARGLAFDPAPRAFRVDAPAGSDARALAASIVAGSTDSHAGVGIATTRERVHVVVLLSSRVAELEPFPRDTAVGDTVVLRGRLPALTRPSLHVTAPSGDSRTLPVRVDGLRFAGSVRFDAAGRWTIEVVGEGHHGPQVAALLTVSCGGASLTAPATADPPDPRDPTQLSARLVGTINATRARQGLAPLQADAALSEVARRHSEAMLRAGVLAHRLEGSDNAAERLRRARIPFVLVLENVARGPSALAAHRLAEESPAHRQNILSADATRVGVGIAREARPGSDGAVYLTELFTAAPGEPEEDRLTPDARVREAIWRERARRGAPPLVSDPRLDDLARAAVREMVRRGEPDPGNLPERALATGRKVSAADSFVTANAADAVRSRNLGDDRFNRVGVGVAIGDDARHGAGLLWIAVIYTD